MAFVQGRGLRTVINGWLEKATELKRKLFSAAG